MKTTSQHSHVIYQTKAKGVLYTYSYSFTILVLVYNGLSKLSDSFPTFRFVSASSLCGRIPFVWALGDGGRERRFSARQIRPHSSKLAVPSRARFVWNLGKYIQPTYPRRNSFLHNYIKIKLNNYVPCTNEDQCRAWLLSRSLC